MNNQEYVEKILELIKSHMKQNNITQKKLVELCKGKKIKISQGTISNAFNTPSSVRLTTLINICDGLNISLSTLMKNIELSLKLPEPSDNLIVYDTSDPAYRGYLNSYHVYFLSTDEKKVGELVHGILNFKNSNTPGPCKALLELNTGDQDPYTKKIHIKKYTGDMIISRVGCIYCNLISYEYGDIWTLVFNHLQLNFDSFIGGIGGGITSSAGGTRIPTIHKVFLSSTELTEDQQFYVCGLLRLYRDEITISTQQLNTLMNDSKLDLKFKRNIERILAKPEIFYSIPVESLKSSVPNKNYVKMLSMLLQYSSMPYNDKITMAETDLAQYIIRPSE
ncbi:antitoxin HipB [Dorea longicatena]|uniref:Antitoxin HipB n=1 Tax=Dorea longicatena TaxID=88431 RepID=A0A173TXX2_9FIRM|nr:helix-turn-helix transcriptional regulator [Dorea longicatena]MBT9758632.1 helix-turn-helix domain-containing protein [Dorea longicatena]CUN07742.1 antitoxin HipB [Dorea longicatena]